MAERRDVLITGCSTGIGRATAERLAARGWTVHATARRLEDIKDLAERGCHVHRLDVCDESSMRDVVSSIGTVGVLVNNAGYGQEGPIEQIPMEAVRRQFETNVFGLVRLTQLVLPGMREQGWGKVVNVSSMGGRMTLPGGGFYHASKHAVESISDALRFEVKGFGIDVVLIEPGGVKTRFGDTAIGSIHDAATFQGPYGRFNEALARKVRSAYEGPLGFFATSAETVARVIERAISSPRPKPRYLITMAAHVMVGLHAVLPDRAWDLFLRTQFRRP